MIRFMFLALLWMAGSFVGQVRAGEAPIVGQRWFEIHTAHFDIYSCGTLPEVYRLAGRLEQFCDAYTLMAAAPVVPSPPIVVAAFPNHETLIPFLPLYHGQPANLAGFFQRGTDENLIVLGLPGTNAAFSDMQVIFHEYSHLLFRLNDRVWPLWLKEGMAEVYSTFETTGRVARIGGPIDHHLRLLAHQPLLPLAELFAVGHDSPQYNERDRQGIFYAESWLLTQFLMAGDNPVYRTRFVQFNQLLHQGQFSEPAFTNAMGTTLPAMEAELRRYLQAGRFTPLELSLRGDVSAPITVTARYLTPVEVYFRLGDELLRIDRLEPAKTYFQQAQKLAPASPLPYEGLGLVAVERQQHAAALRNLRECLQHGSTSFLAHYLWAREQYRLSADAQNRYAPLPAGAAEQIRSELKKSIALMPNFGPAHELLGFFEMVQGDNLALAEQHLQRAIQLEPENSSYLFSLAQVQLRKQDLAAARRTLQPLLLPNVDPKLRAQAEEMLQGIDRNQPVY